jgi:hypothetical protein
LEKRVEIVIEVPLRECDSVGQAIRNLFATSEKYLALGFTIVAAGMTLLTQARDLLLTRLISGKLTGENLDIQFPPTIAEVLKLETISI